MGGIVATFVFGKAKASARLTHEMLAAGLALGSDGSDEWSEGPVSLGVNHFACTPEDDLRLPLAHDTSRQLAIAADVRLDNRHELLEVLDFPLPGSLATPATASPVNDAAASVMTDTELVLACYIRWGCGAFSRLIGSFAVVIWDGRQRRLVCARDALGRRPLYLHCGEQQLTCASSIRQLFRDPNLRTSLNEKSSAAYLVGLQLPLNATFFEGIERLPAGSWMQISEDGRRQLERFWRPASITLQHKRSLADWADDFRSRFTDSVSACLRSSSRDIGLHVSGGLDSTAIVSMVHHLNVSQSRHLQMRAFLNIADQPEADEREYMDAVLSRYPMPQETNRSADYWGFKPHSDMELFNDEPYQAPYIARGLDELAHARRLGISVVLGGGGGDEIGGSSWYLFDRLLRGKIGRLGMELRERADARSRSSYSLVWTLARGVIRHFVKPVTRKPPSWMKAGFRKRWLASHEQPTRTFWNPAREDVLSRLSYCWTEPAVTAVTPVMSSYGVDFRSPFLDQRLFEWALAIPPALLGSEGRVKAPIRLGLEDLLPAEIKNRATKGNYLYYTDLGLRVKERSRIEALLHRSRLAELGFIDGSELQRCYKNYADGGTIDRGHLWKVITLEHWLRMCPLL